MLPAHTFDLAGFIEGLKMPTVAPGQAEQFAAGMLYAGTGQYIDKRDYILTCFVSNDDLNSQLNKAFDFYNDGDDQYKSGADAMMATVPMFTEALKNCTDTNHYFQQMLTDGQNFIT